MLTIFTIPKPFRGHNGIIQKNALGSWMALEPRPDIILCGHEEGIAGAAAGAGARQAPDIETSDYGTPLLSSAFGNAYRLGKNELFCFINADIILMGDFLAAIRRINLPKFLAVGQRWDLDVTGPLDFTRPDREAALRQALAERGKLHGKSGIDYFVFPRRLFGEIPAFAIGRGVWDNWLIYRACSLKAPVIDITGAVTVIHQNHDYAHIKSPDGLRPAGSAADPKAPERANNLRLAGGKDHAFTLEYATHRLTDDGPRAYLTPRHIYFRLRAVPMLHRGLGFLLLFFKAFERLVRVLRS